MVDVATQFNLDETVDTVYRDWQIKQELAFISQSEAEQKATELLINQFKNQLNDVLQSEFQEALNIQVRLLSNTFTVEGVFEYLEKKIVMTRNVLHEGAYWFLSYDNMHLVCFPDSFQKQLIIELGKIKNKASMK
ncbi:hypothetical protein NIES2101_23975 [Calothrix sp. HK-06]|nr:hypothetical protein NIES2101_23840 [Calothrix sp. HK-06]OKH47326.1 hypothetical protein NIES2101_23975 [Calothrix sp. HK-06]